MAYLASKVRSFFYGEKGRAGRSSGALTAGRIWLVLAGLATLIFGVLYEGADAAAIDPWWSRLLMAALPLALTACSYVVPFVRKHIVTLAYATVYVFVSWFVVLTAVNDFSGEYAVGLLFLFVSLGVAPSVGVGHRGLLNGYFAYSLLITTLALLIVPAPKVSRLLFLGCMAGAAFILHIALETRTLVEDDLAASRQRYAAVLQLTADGVLLIDPDTLHILGANPAYCALVGFAQEELRGQAALEIIEGAASALDDEDEEGAALLEHQHRHKSGALIDVEVSFSYVTHEGRDVLCIVVRDIRERKQAERALREAKERAEETLQVKSALLNNVSHELRTPLTGILGFADILLEEADDEQREFAGLIAQNAERLLETLNSVMDLARLEGGRLTLHRTAFSLIEEAKDEVALLQTVAMRKGLFLRCVEEDPGVVVKLDRTCFRRILHNLVGNAIKFTEEGGVTIEVARDGPWGVARVRDTGVGIGHRFLPQLFEEFRQESNGLARTHEGVGLGLAITKRLVDLMGGTIEVESEPGIGSVFTVRLPAREEEPVG